jgi:Fe-S cluster assembly ATP-binding protein
VKFSTFLIAAMNKRLGAPDLSRISDPRMLKNIYKLLGEVGLSRDVLTRELYAGFSGGEKKRAEIMQALLLEPKVVILDEPDSGLDVDGVKMIARVIERLREEGKAILLITHYARLFNYVKPDKVTILINGRVAARGDAQLARLIEEKGYKYIIEHVKGESLA